MKCGSNHGIFAVFTSRVHAEPGRCFHLQLAVRSGDEDPGAAIKTTTATYGVAHQMQALPSTSPPAFRKFTDVVTAAAHAPAGLPASSGAERGKFNFSKAGVICEKPAARLVPEGIVGKLLVAERGNTGPYIPRRAVAYQAPPIAASIETWLLLNTVPSAGCHGGCGRFGF